MAQQSALSGLTRREFLKVIGGGTGQGRYSWNDTVKITTAAAAVGSLTKLTTPAACANTYGCATASCPICGAGQCPP